MSMLYVLWPVMSTSKKKNNLGSINQKATSSQQKGEKPVLLTSNRDIFIYRKQTVKS